MAEQYRFFGSAVGDTREYSQVEFAEVFGTIVGNGYLGQVESELVTTENTPVGMSVIVGTGQAWINGYWYSNETPKEIPIATADATNPRIDRVVLRLDVLNARSIVAVVKTGTPASTPVAPSLTQTEQMWEIPLYQVYVAPSVLAIYNADLTDERYQALLQDTDEILEIVDTKATTTVYTATIPSDSWTGTSAPFSKAVTVTGILSTDTPIIDIVQTGTYETDQAMVTNWALIYRAVTSADTITFYATAVPSADISIQVKVVR